MKKYLYYLLIFFLSVVALFIFYALWHTQAKKITKNTNSITHKTNIDFTHTNDIAQDENSTLSITNTDNTKKTEDTMNKIIKDINITFDTHEKMITRTKQVYDALTPENHDDTIEEANAAFEALETHIENLDIEIQEEESEIDNIHGNIPNTSEDEIPEEIMEEIDFESIKGLTEDTQ